MDRAIRCGLIVNELLTNASQHAFNDQTEGTVTLTFQRRSDQFHLQVEDDGDGFDVDDLNMNNSVGLNMVQTLVSFDLDGQLNIESEHGKGTTVSVEFTHDI